MPSVNRSNYANFSVSLLRLHLKKQMSVTTIHSKFKPYSIDLKIHVLFSNRQFKFVAWQFHAMAFPCPSKTCRVIIIIMMINNGHNYFILSDNTFIVIFTTSHGVYLANWGYFFSCFMKCIYRQDFIILSFRLLDWEKKNYTLIF